MVTAGCGCCYGSVIVFFALVVAAHALVEGCPCFFCVCVCFFFSISRIAAALMLTPRLLLFRLWHQLTLKLFELVNDPSFSGMDCLALYTDFISHFETKLNQVIFI